MRFIPTKFHAPLDYIVGVALIAAPWIFQFSENTAASVVPIVLGIGLIAYSLFTDYELGVSDESANVWMPHVVVGLAAVFLGLTTVQKGGYSYRKSRTPTTAAG
jgi:SPW repeat